VTALSRRERECHEGSVAAKLRYSFEDAIGLPTQRASISSCDMDTLFDYFRTVVGYRLTVESF
jgi:hypothetical protein